MAIKKATAGSFFKENADVVLLETSVGTFRIIEDETGLKISLLATDGNDRICVHPKATNAIVVHQFKQ